MPDRLMGCMAPGHITPTAQSEAVIEWPWRRVSARHPLWCSNPARHRARRPWFTVELLGLTASLCGEVRLWRTLACNRTSRTLLLLLTHPSACEVRACCFWYGEQDTGPNGEGPPSSSSSPSSPFIPKDRVHCIRKGNTKYPVPAAAVLYTYLRFSCQTVNLM